MKKTYTAADIEELLALQRMLDVLSLNTIVTTENTDKMGTIEFGDLLSDDKPGPQEILDAKLAKERLIKYVNKLPPRQCKIIKLRFGLEDGEVKTLDEVGAMYGVTRERIRQIEMKALGRLRWLIKVKDKCRNIEDF